MHQRSKFVSALRFLFFLLGIGAAVATGYLVFSRVSAPPALVKTPPAASECTEVFMQRVCEGNYSEISSLLYGKPNLELDREPADDLGKLLRKAYLDSASYEFLGDCYATETGLARQLRFRCLDLVSVTDAMAPHAREILRTRVENTEDPGSVYDENKDYRQEFIQLVLCEAAQQVLKEDPAYVEREITLQLTYSQGAWLIRGDNTMLSVLLDGIEG